MRKINIFDLDSELRGGDKMNLERVDDILNEIENGESIPQPDYVAMKEKLFQPPKRRLSIPRKRALALAAALCLMLGMTAIAAGLFSSWRDFIASGKLKQWLTFGDTDFVVTQDAVRFDSIQDAFAYAGISAAYPASETEGFSLTDIILYDFGVFQELSLRYQCGERRFSYSFIFDCEDTEAVPDIVIRTGETLSVNNELFLYAEVDGQLTAAADNGGIYTCIMGNLNADELECILERRIMQ